MFVVIISWGSYSGDGKCVQVSDGTCPFWIYATFGELVPKLVCTFIAANLLILLALTSSWFEWVLGSIVMQFMGRISFSLYLVHELFTEWAMVDTYYFFMGKDIDPNLAVLYVFLIYTPIVIFVSWILTVIVDGPSKDFAYQLDIQSRIKRPPPPKYEDKEEEEETEEQYSSCWSFTKRSWKILGFIIWLTVLLIFTEIYSAFKPEQNQEISHSDRIKPNMETLSFIKEMQRLGKRK